MSTVPTTIPPTISLRVDVTNPGQYFACCGLLELASRIAPDTLAWFDGTGQFHLVNTPPLAELLTRITSAGITTLDPGDATASPIQIGTPFNLRLDWWKTAGSATSALKVWAGTMECPRIARAMQHAIKLALSVSGYASENLFCDTRITYDPDNIQKKVEPFYFDAQRGPNAHSRDVGFATNDLGMKTPASPAVEFLCLVGLQRATPAPVPRVPRRFDYHLWTEPLPVSLVPAAVNGTLPDSAQHAYRFESWFRTGQRKHKAFITARPLSS